MELFAPLKKVKLKPSKLVKKNSSLKLKDKVIQLKENCNLLPRCAILSEPCRIDMETVVGHHKLKVVPRSLMKNDGKELTSC